MHSTCKRIKALKLKKQYDEREKLVTKIERSKALEEVEKNYVELEKKSSEIFQLIHILK